MSLFYVTMTIPAGLAFAMNRVVNELEGDAGNNLGSPLSPTGAGDATHYYGGRFMDDATKATYEALKSEMLTPAAGWPLASGVTFAEAEAATAALRLFSYSGPDVEEAGPDAVRAAMLSSMGLKVIVIGET